MKLLKITSIIIITLVLTSCSTKVISQIDLSGEWIVKLDATNIGVTENWASYKFSGSPITLPNTLDGAEIGRVSERRKYRVVSQLGYFLFVFLTR